MPDVQPFGGEQDPFAVVGEIPAGLCYQWCALSVMGSSKVAQPQIERMKRGGWGPVPAKRHPKMRRVKGWIIVENQLLVQKPKRLVEAEQTAGNAVAMAQTFEALLKASFNGVIKVGPFPNDFRVTPVGTTSDYVSDFEVIKDLKETMRHVEGIGHPVAEFEVRLALPLTDSEISTAMVPKLDI